MTQNELNNRYFEWMYRLVCDERYTRSPSYRKLLRHLNEREFTFTIPLDDNRAADGMDLRYRFGYENDYPQAMIASYLDDRPCSVLEMMLALAIRCEEHIMYDSEVGDRTGQWFWNMVVTLGLGSMNDLKFNKNHADEIIDRFLNREYERNGEGGLFRITHPRHDMRDTEIWYQMMWYLEEIIT